MERDRPLAGMLTRALRGGFRLFTLRRAERGDFAASPELFAALVAADVVLMFLFAVGAIGLQ